MRKINFVFGIHNHQPVGNFDFVFEDAFRRSYQPLLDVISDFPDFKVNLHYSGILQQWIAQHHPDHLDQIRRCVERGQAEMLSGGFYEPILPVIPESDAVGQIQKLSNWNHSRFNQKPRGMWLAERVWEPSIPTLMARSGMEFTVIDDAHFKYAGLEGDQLYGYYLTEDQGNMVRLFPISQKLRYTIPFEDPQATLDFLRSLATEEGDRLIVFADDGEKFGIWPDTYALVYEQEWLRKFFALILENADWIKLMHFSEALDQLPPEGRIYLPTASYAEMMHWALPTPAYKKYEKFEGCLKDQGILDDFGVFVRGGFWRNFLTKYPEANLMHKKMLYLSSQAENLAREKGERALADVFDSIWSAQCNCPYWHGVFGGLYLGHIRHAVYQNLLRAEKQLRNLRNETKTARIIITDYDMDGKDEVILETEKLNLYLSPSRGGSMIEMDYFPADFNILNTMNRREEGYHHQLKELAARTEAEVADGQGKTVASIHDSLKAKEEGLEKFLLYDKYERKSFIDHFIPSGVTVDEFAAISYPECGNFVEAPYRLVSRSENSKNLETILKREGTVRVCGRNIPLSVSKKICVRTDKAVMDLNYHVEPGGSAGEEILFGVEMNFALLAGDAPDRYYFCRNRKVCPNRLVSRGEIPDATHFGLADEYSGFRIEMESSRPAKIWYLPVETVSLSEAGFERVYQSSSVVWLFPIELNRPMEVKIQKKIISI